MQTELHVITPSAKPWNIPVIAPRILQAAPCSLAIRWHILVQGEDSDPKGFAKINRCLDYIPMDSYFFTPSDDTIHSIHLFRRFGEIIANNPEIRAVVFSEQRGPDEDNRILHASAENMKPGLLDGSQVIWSRAFVGDKRYDYGKYQHEADGFFGQELFEQDPKAFYFCDEVLCKFNSLEWKP